MKRPYSFIKKRFFYCIILFANINILSAQDNSNIVYKDANAPIEKRVEDLISRMTIEEKVQQLYQVLLGVNNNPNNMEGKVKKVPAEIGSLIYYGTDPVFRNTVQRKAMEESRLGIPIIFGYDVIHGFKTIYPIPLAQACSWNPDLTKEACAMAAKEAKLSGIEWTFSPMVDVAHDPRWGRVAEGYGEDPYTSSVFSMASVAGYQGNNLSDEYSIAACLKHYVGYGASEGGRDYVYTEISRQTLWSTYLPPFKAGVDAGAATIMSAFNDISGIPATANHYTLTSVLKENWGFDGFVVSDWSAVKQLKDQGVAATSEEATLKAFNAGVDMDMADKYYIKYLADLVNEGKVSKERLDDAVKRVLRVKFRLGLFENPYVPEKDETERYLQPQSLAIAEQIAEESIVLLKNKDQILPLKPSLNLAVIGPMADDANKEHFLGSWAINGNPEDVFAMYKALEIEFGKKNLSFAKGCDFEGEDTSAFFEAIRTAQGADAIILCLGEKKTWSGENAGRTSIALPHIQEQLLFELKKTGKPIILLLSNGRPLELCRLEPNCDAIVEVWQPGVTGGKAVAGVLSGRVNPSGKLAMTFPYVGGQIPIYYNLRQTARPRQGKYQDNPTKPLYEFGYGLSYTTYKYGELNASANQIKKGEKITVEIPVTNTGDRDGAETVHWFISDPACSISRPIKELKYFEKKLIKAGETEIFRFDIDPEQDLSFTNEKGEQFLESGDYFIMVKNKKVKLTVL